MRQNLIGVSTAPLARYNCPLSVDIANTIPMNAIELSFLRKRELMPAFGMMDTFDLSQYQYISIHASSDLKRRDEEVIGNILYQYALNHNRNMIVHPNTIIDFDLWRSFGNFVCIENMDARRDDGRTVREMEVIFARLPEASFCLDIGHARQIDGSMKMAADMIREFKCRLKELHVSEVDADGVHRRISSECANDFSKVAHLIPENTPMIIESPMLNSEILEEIEIVRKSFNVV